MSENKEIPKAPENKEDQKPTVKSPGNKKKTTKKPKAEKAKKVKVEILVDNLAGKYLLPWNKGQKVELEAKQAEEMIAAEDAKEVKI